MAAIPITTGRPELDMIGELEELLCTVATGALPNRSEAIVYSRCRSDLLDSSVKALLPGFVYQCLTIFKFKDFITLYDPDCTLREAFVRRTFDRCRSMLEPRVATMAREPEPARGVDAFDPQHWMQ